MLRRTGLPANICYAIAVVLFLLGVNFILRLAFVFYNGVLAESAGGYELLIGFLVGLRFDIATIFIFNGLLFLFLALPIRLNFDRRTYRVFNTLIVLTNIPVILVNCIDVVYYGFADKRLTHELFTTKSDYGAFKPSMLMEWWWLFLLFFALVYLMHRVLRHTANRHLGLVADRGHIDFQPRIRHWVVSGAFALLMYTGVRGGLQETPLWSGKAFVGNTVFAGNLGLNSAFTVISTVEWGPDEEVHLVSEQMAVRVAQDMVRNRFDGPFEDPDYPLYRRASFDEPENRYNVVFLIIESLNASNMGAITGKPLDQSLTPNLDTLARHGRLYTQYFSNGIRSVEAIPALLNSMPEIFPRPTIGSQYAANTHYGLGQMLGERGYTNAFFCGAHNGTMGFDEYARISGIPNYYGMNEYPHAQRDFDGYWGCYDGPFTQWMAQKQNSFQEPFMSVFFSISNHHPFHLPPIGTADIAPRWELTKMEKTTMYTDRVLGEYFRTVRDLDWYDRTIFIITGDHCFHETPDPQRTVMDNYHVPLIIFAPGLEPGVDNRLGNHISVLPTLIDLLKLNTGHSSAGISLLDPERRGFVITNLMGIATLAEGDLAYSSNFEKTLPYHRLEENHWVKYADFKKLSGAVRIGMNRKLRSLYQVMHNTRVRDRLMKQVPPPLSQAE